MRTENKSTVKPWTPEVELNPETEGISSWSIPKIIGYRIEELQKVYSGLFKSVPELSVAVNVIIQRLQNGGRVLTMGAGGSGVAGMSVMREIPQNHRLCDPVKFTYRVPGNERIFEPWGCEELEDSREEGEKDVNDLQINDNDVVIFLSASGRTPYTLSAIKKVKNIGGYTIGITCRSNSELETIVDLPIMLHIGKEMLVGATCEKAATAHKVALDAIMDAVLINLKLTDDNRCLVRVSHEKSKMMRDFNEVSDEHRVKTEPALAI